LRWVPDGVSVRVHGERKTSSMRMHHAAILTRDFDASMRFWRDGIGLEQMMHEKFPGNWKPLFNVDSDTIHSVFLGDPTYPDAGVVEILEFVGAPLEDHSTPAVPTNGLFLLSFNVDLEATLARLAELGLGGEARHTVNTGVRMAVVRDPDGVRVELIDLSAMPDMSQTSQSS
jgi:catechol 2,3-dioxygenase-like lactoylglutathione lyase family enzyme